MARRTSLGYCRTTIEYDTVIVPRSLAKGTGMINEKIEAGFAVFVRDGDKAVGAVREVLPDELVVYVENAGDFAVPLSAVAEVLTEKVVLNCRKLETRLRRAVNHAHQREDPNLP